MAILLIINFFLIFQNEEPWSLANDYEFEVSTFVSGLIGAQRWLSQDDREWRILEYLGVTTIANQKPTIISRMNSNDSMISSERSADEILEDRCCYCPGAFDSSLSSSLSSQACRTAETFCKACQRLHSLPMEYEKDCCKCLDNRFRCRNTCVSRTNVEGVKGHRCRSSVNEGRCLRCASSVVRWTSAKKTVRRLIWLIVPLLLLTFVSPSIAKLQKSSGKINKSGGKSLFSFSSFKIYFISFHFNSMKTFAK